MLAGKLGLMFNYAIAAAGEKKGFQKIFIVLPIVGFLVLCVCTYFCWKWIARRRGNVCLCKESLGVGR